MTYLNKDGCLGGTELFMGGITLVGCLCGFRSQNGSVANSWYATFKRLGAAAAPWKGGITGRAPTLHPMHWHLPYN
jgi:hypothetical protein